MSQQTTQAPSTEETHDTYLDATITEQLQETLVSTLEGIDSTEVLGIS